MIKEIHMRVLPQVAYDNKALYDNLAKLAKVDKNSINGIQIKRQSIDARRYPVMVDMSVLTFINEEVAIPYEKTVYKDVHGAQKVIVVGEGPSGIFASLRLLELGLCPVVLEMGEDVHTRRKSIATMVGLNSVNEKSNYCFGEGGAGAFSDGKLYTRSKKRGNSDKVISQFCQHGADTSILGSAHPHLGTDKLPGIIEQMRKTIVAHGGEVHFNTEVVSLIEDSEKVTGVTCADGSTFTGPVVLAIGHSAGNMYESLMHSGHTIEAKGIAIGARLEHPQFLIDQIQYKDKNGRGKFLPPAEYSFVTQAENRGVYSFCMCPGGFVVPSHTQNGHAVVNGMSPSNRGGKWANSAMVVELHPEDLPSQFSGPLGMLHFQRALEKKTWDCIDDGLAIPVQRMSDFCNKKVSSTLPENSYPAGVMSADLNTLFPAFIAARLKIGLEGFGRKARGFMTNEALLMATESRTSSPVRIVRDKTSLMGKEGLFPCGEGAGYAGGIVSSAVDGMNVADAVARYLA